MDDKIKKYIEEGINSVEYLEELSREAQRDPEIAGAKVPESLWNELLRDVREYESEKAEKARENLSKEDKELLRLGKLYQRKRKYRKYLALAATLVLALALGITSMGGPERLIEKMTWMLAGREQINIDSKDENIVGAEHCSEDEAYEEIEEKYGFVPVRINQRPKGVEFQEIWIGKEIQKIVMTYGRHNEVNISYHIIPNYSVGSYGIDVEDEILKQYTLEVEGINVIVKEYKIEELEAKRWSAEFVNDDVGYFINASNLDKNEFEDIINTLYFL